MIETIPITQLSTKELNIFWVSTAKHIETAFEKIRIHGDDAKYEFNYDERFALMAFSGIELEVVKKGNHLLFRTANRCIVDVKDCKVLVKEEVLIKNGLN